jgi:3',5'-cyclic AMP phosphodiesterase CpdA
VLLAHLSDAHVFTLAGARARDFLGKRLLGGLNMAVHRAREFDPRVLVAALADARALGADHVAVTGDLTNLAFPSEFEAARAILAEHGPAPGAMTVIPGNHDSYVREARDERRFERAFAPWLGEPASGEAAWPALRRLGEVTVIALSSSVPTTLVAAEGWLGERQVEQAEALLAAHRASFRVVLVHHPPVGGRGPWMRTLRDAPLLVAAIARTGAEVVLHGHDHAPLRSFTAGPGRRLVPVLGAPSVAPVRPGRGGYQILRLEDRRLVEVRLRRWQGAGFADADPRWRPLA